MMAAYYLTPIKIRKSDFSLYDWKIIFAFLQATEQTEYHG